MKNGSAQGTPRADVPRPHARDFRKDRRERGASLYRGGAGYPQTPRLEFCIAALLSRLTPQGPLRTLAGLLFGHHVLVLARLSHRLDGRARSLRPGEPTLRRTVPENPHEAYLPTQQTAPSTHARVSGAHGNEERSPGARPASCERPQAPERLSAAPRPRLRRQRHRSCTPPRGRSNRRNVSGTNPNSTGSTAMRAAPPTRRSRSSRTIAAARRRAWDCRSPPGSSAAPYGAIASSVWFGNRSGSISMSCRRWTSSSTRAPVRARRTTRLLFAAWRSTGAR